ncbi:MAG: hypothetical protein NTX24_00720 [Candidatus Pacearchaeota archaeon]|nr:hypothetical protein [Candidatus Pacearchaeota archaeon]
MVEYCKYCGKQRTGEVCHYCGHRYEPKRIDEVKHEMKRQLRKTKMRVPPLLALVIFAVIFALIVLLGVVLLSPQSAKKSTVALNTITNQVVSTISASQTNQTNTAGGSPNLRVFHQMVNQLGGGMGCFGRVDGGVTNSGSADAQNVIVICTAEEYSVEKDLGFVKAHDTKTFQAIINYDCSYQREEECSVSCDNC